jgi:hypothetical protein
MLSQCVTPEGQLYSTAFIDETIENYAERDPSNSRAWCSYNPEYLIGLVEEAGWVVRKIYPGSMLHQPALVCGRE